MRLQMENVKKRLKSLCRPGLHVRPEFAWPLADEEPFEVSRLRVWPSQELTWWCAGRQGDYRAHEVPPRGHECELGVDGGREDPDSMVRRELCARKIVR